MASALKVSGDETRSTAPASSEVSEDFGEPPAIQLRADLKPIRRGNLTVPPHPGMIPKVVSGNPMDALEDITL